MNEEEVLEIFIKTFEQKNDQVGAVYTNTHNRT